MAIPLRFDGSKAAYDMAAKGWEIVDLARHSGLSVRTVYRFVNGQVQTARTARAIAKALGFAVRRYLVEAPQQAVAS